MHEIEVRGVEFELAVEVFANVAQVPEFMDERGTFMEPLKLPLKPVSKQSNTPMREGLTLSRLLERCIESSKRFMRCRRNILGVHCPLTRITKEASIPVPGSIILSRGTSNSHLRNISLPLPCTRCLQYLSRCLRSVMSRVQSGQLLKSAQILKAAQFRKPQNTAFIHDVECDFPPTKIYP